MKLEAIMLPKIKEPAPLFELPDADGKIHKLGDYLGKTIVLYFYPKDDTPGYARSLQFPG